MLAATALLLTACESAGAEQPSAAQSPAQQPAPRVGECDMPVTFRLAESWTPKPVRVEPDDPLAELTRRGPLTMVCEIDAKPAGNIGFLRVWTGAKGEPRASLTAFIGKDAREPVFTELRVGDRPAVEVVYQQKSQLDDEVEQERAFVVMTGQGLAAVSLDSFDSEEHEEMLPAYELAKSSLSVTG